MTFIAGAVALDAGIALALEIGTKLPALIQAGINVVGIVSGIRAVHAQNRAPEDPQWQALDAMITDLENRFDAATLGVLPLSP